MKHIHFFGCSFTVGDELADTEIFPWKSECKSPAEYYERRNPYLRDPDDRMRYIELCKQQSYPSILARDNIKTYNHAQLGASIRENLFYILQTLSSQIPVDRVFLQIPPWPREVKFMPHGLMGVQLASIGKLDTDNIDNNYIKTKVMSHSLLHWACEDYMDLILIKSYLDQKGIPFSLIVLHDELISRNHMLPDYAKFLHQTLMSTTAIIDLTNKISRNDQLTGLHYNFFGHKKIANAVLRHINEPELAS